MCVLPKAYNDPTRDAHILVVGFRQKLRKHTNSKKSVHLVKTEVVTRRLVSQKKHIRYNDVNIRCVAESTEYIIHNTIHLENKIA